MSSLILVVPIIILLSLIQSLFGVGLLVFGTPLLLVLGFSFKEALSILLPCSLVINLLQLQKDYSHVRFKKLFLATFIPTVSIGLFITLHLSHHWSPKPLIGALLLLTGTTRLFPSLATKLQSKLLRLKIPALCFIGLIHGLSNMGGGLLTLFVSSLYQNKREIRAGVAFGYLLMGFTQWVVLLSLDSTSTQTSNAILPLIAILTYLFMGQILYAKLSSPLYQQGLTGLILFFGTVLLI